MTRVTRVDPVAEAVHQEIPTSDVFLPVLLPLALKIWRMDREDWARWSVIRSILRFAYLLYPGRGQTLLPQGSALWGTVDSFLSGPWQGLPQEKKCIGRNEVGEKKGVGTLTTC